MSLGMPWGWALLLVAVGGGAGAVLRHLVVRSSGAAVGLLVVNVLGAAALGALSAVAAEVPGWAVLILGVGLCGAMTTWSSLAVHVAEVGRASLGRAAAYLAVSVVLGVGAAVLTHLVVAWLLRV